MLFLSSYHPDKVARLFSRFLLLQVACLALFEAAVPVYMLVTLGCIGAMILLSPGQFLHYYREYLMLLLLAGLLALPLLEISLLGLVLLWFVTAVFYVLFQHGGWWGMTSAAIFTLTAVALLLSDEGQGLTLETGSLVITSWLLASACLGGITALFLQQQKEATEQIRASDVAKTEFLSGISHELRTPLNSIMGFADILSRGYAGPLEGKQNDFVNNISASSRHMLALVNDLLDISRIESGQIEFVPEDVDLGVLVDEVSEMFEEESNTRRISFDRLIENGVMGCNVQLDKVKFRQILINLLANAFKFTDEGNRVAIRTSLDGNTIIIRVTDNGRGIPAGMDQKIFEKFYQVHSSTSDKSPGTGLGLPISKHFAELHGGTILLDRSGLSSETTFVVRLPCVRAA